MYIFSGPTSFGRKTRTLRHPLLLTVKGHLHHYRAPITGWRFQIWARGRLPLSMNNFKRYRKVIIEIITFCFVELFWCDLPTMFSLLFCSTLIVVLSRRWPSSTDHSHISFDTMLVVYTHFKNSSLLEIVKRKSCYLDQSQCHKTFWKLIADIIFFVSGFKYSRRGLLYLSFQSLQRHQYRADAFNLNLTRCASSMSRKRFFYL